MRAVMPRTPLDWLRRWIWPEAPLPVTAPAPVDARGLLLKACEIFHYAGAGNLGALRDDVDHADAVAETLQRILADYRSGRAQTREERVLGAALSHVAQAYLRA